ncbi:MAG: chitobiase/beta-hexosaminidase C-terminal domain-containing protein, partial [Sedimentisphaerales bacterium]|nr:chitobiase/beta-hexosaminidase C-terminal domain-containing protein [Sedimentisphaerales bacterium]
AVVHAYTGYEYDTDQFGYPPQEENISYGLSYANEMYFTNFTPGKRNIPGFAGFVSDTKFSHDRGFYKKPPAGNLPLRVAITCKTPGAIIRYTTDGSDPSPANGHTYSEPLVIEQTTCLRAAAFKPGWKTSNIDTHTYVFVEDVVKQGIPKNGDWPTSSINGQKLDYGMDPDITNPSGLYGELYADLVDDALLDIPTLSLVTPLDNLFDSSTGIYVNARSDGRDWERPTSLELLYPDGRQGFQIDAGFRIRGGYSRSSDNPKHAFRLFFREEYGSSRLQYALFGDEGVDSFEKIDLRCAQNYSWSYGGDSKNTMCREVFSRDTQRDMGQPYTRSRYYHLYINGTYWGLYQTQERSEARYAESYFGGETINYDTVKVEAGSYVIQATDGTLDEWRNVHNMALTGFTQMANYYRLLGLNTDGTDNPIYPKYLDVDNLIDYMICTYYVGDFDGPISNFLGNSRPNNFYGIFNRTNPDGFKFFRHDAEHSLFSGWDRTGPWPAGQNFSHFNPQWLHQRLEDNQEYRIRFADAVHKYFFNNGALTPEVSQQRFMTRANQIETAVIAESARWGDARSSTPLNKLNWLNEINSIVNYYFPERTQQVLNQLKNKGWYPATASPTLNRQGGHVEPGFSLTMTNPNTSGIIYYTLDGTDPRKPIMSEPGTRLLLVGENAAKRIWIPTQDIGTIWTGESEPYDDSDWTDGTFVLGKTGGVGYERGAGFENYISYDVNSEMQNFTCAYIRVPFSITASELAGFEYLTLYVRYDDAFVAYLNGHEVTRSSNVTGTPQWDSQFNRSSDNEEMASFSISSHINKLQAGQNILALHGINSSTGSTDFLISAELVGGKSAGPLEGGNPSVTAQIYTEPISIEQSTCIKARILRNSEWSALNEASFATEPFVEHLRITEIMYNPLGDPNLEYIELTNTGDVPLDLSLARFSKGIGFTFGANSSFHRAILVSSFTSGTDGFTFNADAFNTNNPSAVDGSYVAAGGFEGGGLLVYLEQAMDQQATSAAWSKSFELPENSEVIVSLRYRLFMKNGYDPDEYSQAIMTIDGVRYGPEAGNSLIRRVGDGDGGPDNDYGWQEYQIRLSLTAGIHTLTLGAFNNKSTTAWDEWTEVYFDDIVVSINIPASTLIESQQRIVLVRDARKFQARYGTTSNIAGEFSGRLDDGGERLTLVDAAGTVIQSV